MTADAPDPAPVRLYGPRFQRDPFEVYREIRRTHGSVAPILLEGDVPAWLVLGYRELRQVTENPQLFARDSRRWNAWDRVPPDSPLLTLVAHRPGLIFSEGEEHRRHAGAVSAALAAVDQFELRAQCERIADDLVDSFAGSGTAELIADFARPMPMSVLTVLFGLSAEDAANLVRDMLAASYSHEEAFEAHMRAVATTMRLVRDKRERPGPDIPSRMMERLSELDDEIIAQNLLATAYGAQLPTAEWIGNTLRLMLTDRRFAVSLSGGRRSVGEALNEVLWAESPTQNFIGRWAVRDTRLGGRLIRTGDVLVLGLAAANTDPQIWPGSEVGAGGNRAHMAFSHGEHGCPRPAPELAEIIANVAIEVLLDRLPDLALAVAPDELTWRLQVWQRGLAELPVVFSPAYVS